MYICYFIHYVNLQITDPIPQRNLPYSTFLPSSSTPGPIQSPAVNQNGIPQDHMINSQQLQKNRLSYNASNNTSSKLAPTVSLPLASNGINSTYETLNSSMIINRNSNGISCNQEGPKGIDEFRPAAIVGSYITSLSNHVRSKIKCIKTRFK